MLLKTQNFIFLVNIMPSKRRSGCGQPKVYIDVDDSTVSLNVSNNAAEVTSEPGDVNTGGSPHPYFLCKVDNDWSEEEEVSRNQHSRGTSAP